MEFGSQVSYNVGFGGYYFQCVLVLGWDSVQARVNLQVRSEKQLL